MIQTVIKKRAVFADIHQDTRDGKPHIFALKYRKKDRTVSYKKNLSKSQKNLPGESKFRSNVKLNNVLLLFDHDANHHFEIKIDYMVEYNHMIIDHQS